MDTDVKVLTYKQDTDIASAIVPLCEAATPRAANSPSKDTGASMDTKIKAMPPKKPRSASIQQKK